jgi:hypothetical protein
MKKLLQSYIRNEITKSEFSDAMCSINGIENDLGRSQFLQLKHGNKVTALECFQSLNQCTVCSQLRTDDLAHSDDIRQKLDSCIKTSKIERAQKPSWYTPHLAKKNPYGAQGFFNCNECGAILDVCEPERMYRGCCEVIG